jgi:hypothetical protein
MRGHVYIYIYIYIYIYMYIHIVFVRSLKPLHFMFAHCGWVPIFTLLRVHRRVLTPLRFIQEHRYYMQILFSASSITEGQIDSFLLGLGRDYGK